MINVNLKSNFRLAIIKVALLLTSSKKDFNEEESVTYL